MALAVTKKRKELTARIRFERERLGFTEKQIAQLIGIPIEKYQQVEAGEFDPGLFSLMRLTACGFDANFIITGERLRPLEEENELLQRFRELSIKGKSTIFMTLDALERLAPNLRSNIRKNIRDNLDALRGKFKID
jgi:transcriptional regulator with XRE-family HTH domain